MNFSQAFPSFYQNYSNALEKMKESYLKVGRLSHYLGSGYILAFSNFGHKYKVKCQDLEAIKPLFKPSPSDLAISVLSMHLHTLHAHYAYVCPSTSYHLLNHASIQNGAGSIFVIDSDQQNLLEVMDNTYLNDLHPSLIPYHLPSCERLTIKRASILEPLESSSPSYMGSTDTTLFDRLSACPPGSTFESLLGENHLMELRGVVFDQCKQLPLPQEHLADLTLLNPSCYFLVRIDPTHLELSATFHNRWQEAGYGLWRLPDLKAFEKVHALYPTWILIAQASCFNS